MAIDNDTRGWILAGISGVACIFGAVFICIDVIVRLFPGKKGWKIQDSNAFLSCSLSLSAGVMLFSSLYKLLPEAKSTLIKGGFSPKAAAWTLIACFLVGVWGIQIISRIMHFIMPSHVVDCDHTHEDDTEDQKTKSRTGSRAQDRLQPNGQGALETTPLLMVPDESNSPSPRRTSTLEMTGRAPTPLELGTWDKPSLQKRMTRTMTQFVSGEKSSCNQDGPCKGYSSPCGQECFKNISARGGIRAPSRLASVSVSRRPTMRRSASTSARAGAATTDDHQDPEAGQGTRKVSAASLAPDVNAPPSPADSSYSYGTGPFMPSTSEFQATESTSHHHHVPQNAFLALSFQTSIGLVLHKLPEGFITYASNHANPNLGFNIFMALAIHNITEGFALALPIYLATNSRWRALLYSFGLGGLSQPLGAAIAAVWLKLAERGKGEYAPSEGVYGSLFAATAGILATVALNLLSQSFELCHNKGLCMFFVFVGMGILGVSSALIA